MERTGIRKLLRFYSDYSFFAQKAIGKASTLEVKKNLDFKKIIDGFHCFDVFTYVLVDVTELKIVQVGGAIKQLTGYDESYFEGKGFYRFIRLHSIQDMIRSLSGSSQYFKYLYSQEKEKRPFIKSNRTVDLNHKNGTKTHVLVQSIPVLFNDKMEVVKFLVIATDISAIKVDRKFSQFIIDSSDREDIKKIPINHKEQIEDSSFLPSPAEKKVLQYLSIGLSSKQIADKLFLSEHTVKNHRKNMLRKFECSSSSGLVRKAIINGWV
jgi:DNA-binding CsgD family transcriptional regulator